MHASSRRSRRAASRPGSGPEAASAAPTASSDRDDARAARPRDASRVPDRPLAPRVELLVFRFAPGAQFRGRLVGALERLESGGALRVLDLLFASADAAGGEPVVLATHRLEVGALLSFRLDEAERRRATERALGDREDGLGAGVVRELARGLEPGAAVAAVLVEHVWARALDDAVRATAGACVRDERVDATALRDLGPALLGSRDP